MTNTINVLVVEDDDDQWETYQDSATERTTEEVRIILYRYTSSREAQASLLSNSFDAAIVDLNLSPGEPGEASGNEVLLAIKESHRFPVLIVSGNLANLDEGVQTSGFLKTYHRDTPNEVIFNYNSVNNTIG